MTKIILVSGTRPNFVKIAPIIRVMNKVITNGASLSYKLVHTGQHYDDAMSGSFFKQLEIPEPDINLGCGGGTHAQQTASILIAFEKYLLENDCDWVIVVGDVNSTMACTLAAKKLNIKVAHVEAGIRSGDMRMPEEINRIVTDSICDVFFTTSRTANEYLTKVGIKNDKIVFVGNTMIDSLLYNQNKFIKPALWETNQLKAKDYIILTLHRPSNVDTPERLQELLNTISTNLEKYNIIFPIHPRTEKNLQEDGRNLPNLILTGPLTYLEFNYLVKYSLGVITDSGGITEETTVLGIPCITLRENTERPETVTIGTNVLIGNDHEKLIESLYLLSANQWKKGDIPELWDGQTSERIVKWFIQWGKHFDV